MSVATAGTIVIRRNLVQRNELDPRQYVVFNVSSAGDATGGVNEGICTVPAGFACMWVSVGCEMDASSSSPVAYSIAQGTGTILQRGSAAISIDTLNIPNCFDPPRILLTQPDITCTVLAENTNLETLTVRVQALLWDLQVARNVPQAFLWPAELG